MGPLIRLCLHSGVEPWFIPMAEPWRNGVVEKFNDHYHQRFLDKIPMATQADLMAESLGFEQGTTAPIATVNWVGKHP